MPVVHVKIKLFLLRFKRIDYDINFYKITHAYKKYIHVCNKKRLFFFVQQSLSILLFYTWFEVKIGISLGHLVNFFFNGPTNGVEDPSAGEDPEDEPGGGQLGVRKQVEQAQAHEWQNIL